MSDRPYLAEVYDAGSRYLARIDAVQEDMKKWPDEGEIELDLAKEKTEKDFGKKKKKWNDKLDESQKLHDKAEDALNEWREGIQKSESAFKKWEKEKSATDAEIRDVIKAIDKINSWLTQLGFDAVEKPTVDSWSEVMKTGIEFGSEIDGQKKLAQEWDDNFTYYRGELSLRYRELEKAKFKGAGGKGAPKPAKRR